MSTSPRWKHRPPGSNWGDFGPDDQHGRMNLLTPEKVKQGIADNQKTIATILSDNVNGQVVGDPQKMTTYKPVGLLK